MSLRRASFIHRFACAMWMTRASSAWRLSGSVAPSTHRKEASFQTVQRESASGHGGAAGRQTEFQSRRQERRQDRRRRRVSNSESPSTGPEGRVGQGLRESAAASPVEATGQAKAGQWRRKLRPVAGAIRRERAGAMTGPTSLTGLKSATTNACVRGRPYGKARQSGSAKWALTFFVEGAGASRERDEKVSAHHDSGLCARPKSRHPIIALPFLTAR
jgi:hypothetical protein